MTRTKTKLARMSRSVTMKVDGRDVRSHPERDVSFQVGLKVTADDRHWKFNNVYFETFDEAEQCRKHLDKTTLLAESRVFVSRDKPNANWKNGQVTFLKEEPG